MGHWVRVKERSNRFLNFELFVSDAGAAWGNFDPELVDNTKRWIELKQSVHYFTWLNPMPSEC